MPHGLTTEFVEERIKAGKATWCRPLNDANKSKKPLRLIGVEGPYGRLEVIEGHRARQVRVRLERLELTAEPVNPHSKKPPAPAPDIAAEREKKRLEELRSMFPLLDKIDEPAPPVVTPEPPKPEEKPMSAKPKPKPGTSFVVYEVKGKRYYTERKTWVWDVGSAKTFDNVGLANRSAGRLTGKNGTLKGQEVVVLREDVAREMFEAQKQAGDVKAEPEAPAPEVAEDPSAGIVTCSTPKAEMKTLGEHLAEAVERETGSHDGAHAHGEGKVSPPIEFPKHVKPTTMSDEMATLQFALETALRNELTAYELLQHRKVETARIKHEIDIHITRKKNAYR